MLILIGTVPTAYALNRAVHEREVADLRGRCPRRRSDDARRTTPMRRRASADPRGRGRRLRAHPHDRRPRRCRRSQQLTRRRSRQQVGDYGSMRKVPAGCHRSTSATTCTWRAKACVLGMRKARSARLSAESRSSSTEPTRSSSTTRPSSSRPGSRSRSRSRSGSGTMVGWKRIVVTVGEKIGKTHLTYAQGASAEIVAMVDDRRGRHLRPAGQHDPRAVVGRRRHDGGQRLRPAMEHGAQPARWPGC